MFKLSIFTLLFVIVTYCQAKPFEIVTPPTTVKGQTPKYHEVCLACYHTFDMLNDLIGSHGHSTQKLTLENYKESVKNVHSVLEKQKFDSNNYHVVYQSISESFAEPIFKFIERDVQYQQNREINNLKVCQAFFSCPILQW